MWPFKKAEKPSPAKEPTPEKSEPVIPYFDVSFLNADFINGAIGASISSRGEVNFHARKSGQALLPGIARERILELIQDAGQNLDYSSGAATFLYDRMGPEDPESVTEVLDAAEVWLVKGRSLQEAAGAGAEPEQVAKFGFDLIEEAISNELASQMTEDFRDKVIEDYEAWMAGQAESQ